MKRLLCLLAFLGLAAGCSDEPPTSPLAPGGPAFAQVAADPVVTSLSDLEDDGCDVNDCTLREAIAFADPGATITFGVSGTIPLVAGPLVIARDLEISGPGAEALAVSGEGQTRVFEIGADALVRISGVTIRNGAATSGAGLQNEGTTVLFGVVVRGNHAFSNSILYGAAGGGISNSGDLTLENSAVTDNTAYSVTTPIAGGGGISSGGALTLIGSTVAGNYVRASLLAYGGGIFGFDITLSNSTVADNQIEANESHGAGIYVRSYSETTTGSLSLTNSTVSRNHGFAYEHVAGGGGISVHTTATAIIANALVAANQVNSGEWGTTTGPDVEAGAGLITATYSLIGSADGNSIAAGVDGNIVGVAPEDLLLGELSNNGGPTETVALLPGSPAIDAGSAADCPFTDQRGGPRPQGDGCDIGAFEARAYSLDGFFAPVENLPALNEVKAGRAVPLKFSLEGNQGLTVLAPGSPTSEEFSCDGSAVTTVVEETTTAGQSGLAYDPSTNTYTYIWKTDKAWANSCRRFTLQLSDEAGTTRTAEFRFVK